MNRELLYVIEQIGREKGIGTEVLFEALESALLSASKRTMGVGENVRLTVDRLAGPRPHLPADGPRELPVLLELPGEPG